MLVKRSIYAAATALAASTMFSGHAEITGSGFRELACNGVLHINVWADLDGDGVQGRFEESFPKVGLVVSMTDHKELGTERFVTDGQGQFDIDHLCEGTYNIEIEEESVPSSMTFDAVYEMGNVIIDGEVNSSIDVTLSDGSNRLTPGERDLDIAYTAIIRGLRLR